MGSGVRGPEGAAGRAARGQQVARGKASTSCGARGFSPPAEDEPAGPQPSCGPTGPHWTPLDPQLQGCLGGPARITSGSWNQIISWHVWAQAWAGQLASP